MTNMELNCEIVDCKGEQDSIIINVEIHGKKTINITEGTTAEIWIPDMQHTIENDQTKTKTKIDKEKITFHFRIDKNIFNSIDKWFGMGNNVYIKCNIWLDYNTDDGNYKTCITCNKKDIDWKSLRKLMNKSYV